MSDELSPAAQSFLEQIRAEGRQQGYAQAMADLQEFLATRSSQPLAGGNGPAPDRYVEILRDKFGLNERVYNILKRERMHTIQDVLNFDGLRPRDLGPGRSQHLRDVLRNAGYDLTVDSPLLITSSL